MSAPGTGTPTVLNATINVADLVAKLTLLGESLGGEELDNFNNATTLFSERLQATGDWQGSFDAAFGTGSVFQNVAKSDLLAAAIQAVEDGIGFVQGLVNIAKSIL